MNSSASNCWLRCEGDIVTLSILCFVFVLDNGKVLVEGCLLSPFLLFQSIDEWCKKLVPRVRFLARDVSLWCVNGRWQALQAMKTISLTVKMRFTSLVYPCSCNRGAIPNFFCFSERLVARSGVYETNTDSEAIESRWTHWRIAWDKRRLHLVPLVQRWGDD